MVGLWPFSFGIENAVRRLTQKSGVEFYNLGIVFTHSQSKSTGFNHSSEQFDALSIEIWFEPAKEPDKRGLIFFSFNDTEFSPQIVLEQWKSSLIIRTRDKGGIYEKQNMTIRSQNTMLKGEKRLLTITSGPAGTAIYLDGKRAGLFPKYRLLDRDKSFSIASLVLGNDPTGKRPWNGKIFGLSFYDQELSEKAVFQSYQRWIQGEYSKLSRQKGIIAFYPMDEPDGPWIYNRSADRLHLWIPERFQVPKQIILNLPWADNGFKKFKDIAVNVLGFIPFGFLGLAFFSSIRMSSGSFARSFFFVVFAGCFLSLVIELLQVYLPSRYSSSTDLICNIFGTAVGASLYYLTTRKLSLLNLLPR
jgi:hypothetical protein